MLTRLQPRSLLAFRHLSSVNSRLSSRPPSVASHETAFPLKQTPASIRPPKVYRAPESLTQAEKEEIITKRKADPVKNSVTVLAKQFNLHKTSIMNMVSAPHSRHQQLKEEWEAKHRKIDIDAWAEKCRQIEKERAASIKAANKEWYATLHERKKKNLDPRVIFAPDYKLPKDEVRRRDKL